MKQDEMIVLGVAVFVAYQLLTKAKQGGGTSRPASWVSEITNGADPGEDGWGWRYYDNGVAISPSGAYYQNGQLVWKP